MQEPGYFARLFRAAESNQIAEVRSVLDRIGQLLREGMPRLVDKSAPIQAKDVASSTQTRGAEFGGALSGDASITAKLSEGKSDSQSAERSYSIRTSYRLTVSDVLRILGDLREKAQLSATYMF